MEMQACERSDTVPERKTSHTHYLAGVYRGGHNIIFREKNGNHQRLFLFF
jgi:coatomer protein complex subunit gamma